ncbi:B-cell receptor CD22-like [Thunnus thynnus]|uniref:B-cell receptor CD22-like n=1 Tax=Thunnus thynnus TaxID=8237 RepID=UPI0035286C59
MDAPKLPSVSVSPSGEIVEGSSVTLTCSSDAKPAANYTWYKENENSPKALGKIFTFIDFRLEHSGNYYCEAQNKRGRHNSTLHLIVMAGSMKAAAVGSITFLIFLAIIFLSAFLLIRRKRSSKRPSEPRPDNKAQLNVGSGNASKPAGEEDDLYYSSVRFFKNQEEVIYSNIRPAHLHKQTEEEEEEDDVDYTNVVFESASNTPGLRYQEAVEDSSVLYSTINKNQQSMTT